MSIQSSCFEVSIKDKVAHVVISRGAEFNTFTPQKWIDLPQIIHDIDRNAKARVIVISSTGKHFTAGMDLAVFTRPTASPARQTDPHLRAEALPPRPQRPAGVLLLPRRARACPSSPRSRAAASAPAST